MSAPIIILVVLAFIAIDAATLFFVFRRLKEQATRNNANWKWLAERMGLQVEGGQQVYPTVNWLAFLTTPVVLSGQYRGHTMRLYVVWEGSGRSRTRHYIAQITGPNARGLRFECARPQGFFSRNRMKLAEVKTGNSAFDGACQTWSNDPAFLKVALLPELQNRVQELWKGRKSVAGFRLDGEALLYDCVEPELSDTLREDLVKAADILCELRGIAMFYNR